MARYNTKEKLNPFPCGLTTAKFKLEMTKDKKGSCNSFILTIFGKKPKVLTYKVDKKGLNIAFEKVQTEIKSLFLTQKQASSK